MKYKTYTFRAYPNKTQANLMNLTFIMCKNMYNTLLRIVLENYCKYNNEVNKCLKNNENFDEEKFSKVHKLPKISVLKKVHDDYKKSRFSGYLC